MGEAWSQPDDSSSSASPNSHESRLVLEDEEVARRFVAEQVISMESDRHHGEGTSQFDLEEALKGTFLDIEPITEEAYIISGVLTENAGSQPQKLISDGYILQHETIAATLIQDTSEDVVTSEGDKQDQPALQTSFLEPATTRPTNTHIITPSALSLARLSANDLDALTVHHAKRLTQLFHMQSNAIAVADYIAAVSERYAASYVGSAPGLRPRCHPIVEHVLRAIDKLPLTTIVTPCAPDAQHQPPSSGDRHGDAVGACEDAEVHAYGWAELLGVFPPECRVRFFTAREDVMRRGEEDVEVGEEQDEARVGVVEGSEGDGRARKSAGVSADVVEVVGANDTCDCSPDPCVCRLLPLLTSSEPSSNTRPTDTTHIVNTAPLPCEDVPAVLHGVPLPSVLVRARTGLFLSGLSAREQVLVDVLVLVLALRRASRLDAFVDLYDELLGAPRDVLDGSTSENLDKDSSGIPTTERMVEVPGFPGPEFGLMDSENTFDNLQILVDVYFTSVRQAQQYTQQRYQQDQQQRNTGSTEDTSTGALMGVSTGTPTACREAPRPELLGATNTHLKAARVQSSVTIEAGKYAQEIPASEFPHGNSQISIPGSAVSCEPVGDALLYTLRISDFLRDEDPCPGNDGGNGNSNAGTAAAEKDAEGDSKDAYDAALLPGGRVQRVVTIVDDSVDVDVAQYLVPAEEAQIGAGCGFEEGVWVDLFDTVYPHVPDDMQLLWDANAVAASVRRMAAGDALWWRLRLRADVWSKRGDGSRRQQLRQNSPVHTDMCAPASIAAASLSSLSTSVSGIAAEAAASLRPTVAVRGDTVVVDTPDARIVLPPRKYSLRPSLFKQVPEQLCADLLEIDGNLASLHQYFVPRLLPAVLFWAEYMACAAEVIIETVNKGHY